MKEVKPMMKTLDQKIKELSKSSNEEDKQVFHWLSQLKEYIQRDTPMKITHCTLSGCRVCPKCGKLMKLGITDGFCNECGQAVKLY